MGERGSSKRGYQDASSFEELSKLLSRGPKKEVKEDHLVDKRPTLPSSPSSPSDKEEHAFTIKEREVEEDLVFTGEKDPMTATLMESLGTTMDEHVTLPMTSVVSLSQHAKLVSSIDFDKSGSRLVSGSHDQTIALWDFAGMDNTFQPFRFLRQTSNCPVRMNKFSPTGDKLLVIGGSASPVLLDRNGALCLEYAKGDPYLRNMKITHGHVGPVLCADWNPIVRGSFITAGQDGTIRWWSETGRRCNQTLVVRNYKAGKNFSVNQAKFHPDGSQIFCTTTDGSLRIYSSKGPWINPVQELTNAFNENVDITGLTIDESGKLIATRSTDDSLRLWDVRKLNGPIGVAKGLNNAHEETNVIFSPDGSLLLTGTSVKQGTGQQGTIEVFDSSNLNPITSLPVAIDTSVISLAWHSGINQIFAGLGDGTVQAFYDREISSKGVMLAVDKIRTTTGMFIGEAKGVIHNPNSLPLFRTREGKSLKRIRIKARKNPLTSQRPELPVEGPGIGGRLGSSVTQSIMKHLIKDTSRDEDPRESLLKYAEIAEKDPKFVTPAYLLTQPKAVLDDRLLKKEADEEAKRKTEEERLSKLANKLNKQS